MAHLSDDDVPTMTGTPGSLIEEPEDSGDTTSADLSVPVAAAIHAAAEAVATKAATPPTDDDDDDTAGHDAEDRTVQQKVGTPGLRGSRPDAPSPPTTGPSTLASASPASPTAPATGPPTQAASPNTVASPTSSSPNIWSTPSTEPSGSPTTVDDDELEDSVTATAPRIPASKLNITIPGAVEIRTVDHDELLDETEVKTMANLSPELERAIKNARLQSPNAPQPSQPPPPPRPAAGVPAAPSIAAVTKPSRDNDLAATAPSPHANAPTEAVIETELDPDDLAPDSDEVLPADEESVTSQSLAPRVGSMPDTEVSPPSATDTPKDLPPTSRASMPEPETSKTGADAAVAAAIAAAEIDELQTRPGLGEASADDPPTRPGLVEPPTRPGIGEPPTSPRAGDPPTNPRPGDPITYPRTGDVPTSKRVEIRSSAESEVDDSITTQAPKLPPNLIAAVVAKATAIPSSKPAAKSSSKPPAIDDDDSTDGMTTKVKRANVDPSDAPTSRNDSPADGESESITTQAPGPLTNILRVIAADGASGGDERPIEEEEPEENRTAVMANAPLIRAAEQNLVNGGRSGPLSVPTQMGIGPRAVAAPQLNPTSESGLRVARPGSGSGERMSTGAIPNADPRTSGVARSAMPGDSGAPHGLALANTELAFPPGSTPQPSLHDVDLGKGPRYGLLVAIVAFVSFVVPVTLFFFLRGGDTPATPGTPNEPAGDFQKHDGPRTKLEKGKKPPPDPSATPSASASASGSAKPPDKRFPFRR